MTTIAENTGAKLVADIGGTHARFAYFVGDQGPLQGLEKYRCDRFADLADALRTYMAQHQSLRFTRICLAVAGPVEQSDIRLPNSPWRVNPSMLSRELTIPVEVINDFSAQVLSIDGLGPDQFLWVGDVRPTTVRRYPLAVLGAGTGLGVAALTPDGYILPSEGGHVSFAPANGHQAQLLEQLWQRFPRVSAERLLSGMGLANLYWANCRLAGVQGELSAAEVTAGARAGDPHCLRAVADFSAVMGAVAGDAALTFGALDGVYLSGGILPQMLDILDIKALYRGFTAKGRFQAYCEKIPLAVVLAEEPGLIGCARALSRNSMA
ncbi:MAG: glucokinase [Spongiibacter sp.]|nr:glucokinase [Spongiibacter sp.]